MSSYRLKYTLILIVLLFSNNIFAQVTIGSGDPPMAGALLDLKESPITQKGLLLPRVNIEDLTKLKMGDTPELTGNERSAHTGLMVYNVGIITSGSCPNAPSGIYVWSGDDWQPLGIVGSLSSSISTDKTILSFHSGSDFRGSVQSQALGITWSAIDNKLHYSSSGDYNGPLVFSAANQISDPITTSPTTLNLLPDAITVTNPNNPWISRQTVLKFIVCDTESGEITLNQTNFALKVNNTFANTSSILMNVINTNFPVQGNAIWQATKLDPDDILASFSTSGGINITTGTSSTATFNFASAPGPGTRFKEAQVIISDPEAPKRFDDFTVNLIECLGSADMSTLNAANGVQAHVDDRGDGFPYTFYSADFGVAGRWMITSLAARTYVTAGRTGTDTTVPRALTGPSNLSSGVTVGNYWCFPARTGVSDPNDQELFIANPQIGLLYNWAAATNSKATSGGDEGNSVGQAKIQGIFPNGWHLPSDYEWTQLENVISENTSRYSSLPDITPGNANSIDPNTIGYRGTLQGKAMKDQCEYYTSTNIGASKKPYDGGFSAFLTGYFTAGNGVPTLTSSNYGQYGQYWTSSRQSSSTAWYRRFFYDDSRVFRTNPSTYPLMSVRCKQD